LIGSSVIVASVQGQLWIMIVELFIAWFAEKGRVEMGKNLEDDKTVDIREEIENILIVYGIQSIAKRKMLGDHLKYAFEEIMKYVNNNAEKKG
jgi:hypothetical protein